MSLRKHKEWVAVAILLAIWTIFAVDFISRTTHVSIDHVRYFTVFDDGMIGMRYAKNLVEHHALVWNLGERVEGFSNFLWVLIMAGTIWVFGTHLAPLIIQVLGGLICLFLFWHFYRNAMRNQAGLLAAFVGLFFLVTSYPVSYWALAGMEACAICLLYALAVNAQYSYENGLTKNPLLLHSILIAIGYSLRPDGWLAIAPFFAACWFDCVKEKNYRRALVAVVIPSAVVVVLMAARVAYYGEWVPNTYVLKVQGYSLALRLKNGIAFVTPFWHENLGALCLILLSAVTRKRVAFLNIAGAGIVLAYQIYVGGDPWLFWRQLVPIYVATAFAIVLLLKHLKNLAESTRNEGQSLNPRDTARRVVITLLPAVLYECYVFSPFSRINPLDQRPVLLAYLAAALVLLIFVSSSKRVSAAGSHARDLIILAKLVVVIVVAYAFLLGNLRFRMEFGNDRFMAVSRNVFGKPYTFAGLDMMIDKAVLANRLFGPGKTHHAIWSGAYPYYVDGTIIDALGKSDKKIARYPVNEAFSWNNMHGVPGHAKYNFRESILERRPDIIADGAGWGEQDVSPEMNGSYVLIRSQDVSLCVKKELSAGIEPLIIGECSNHF